MSSPFTVELTRSCLTAMEIEAGRWAPLETGGVLIGRWISPTEVQIRLQIGPGPNARHDLTSFSPDQDYHEREIADVFRQTSGAMSYLGDWHTHPGSDAFLSKQDRSTLARIARSEEAQVPQCLMVILAGGAPWRCAVWKGWLVRRFWGTVLRTERAKVRLIG